MDGCALMTRRWPLRGVAVLVAGVLAVFALGCGASKHASDTTTVSKQVTAPQSTVVDPATTEIDKRIATALASTRSSPRKPAAWAQLARLRYQRATIADINPDGTYSNAGKDELRLAAQAWERYIALDPKHPDPKVARLMVQTYGASGIGDPGKAVQAMEIVTAAEKPPSSNLYAQLAQLAYLAHDSRTAQLASDRALRLASPSERAQLRTALAGLKAQAAQH
jgi:hypothetical protein